MSYPLDTFLKLDLETLQQRFDMDQTLIKSDLYWLEHYERCLNEPEFLLQQINTHKEKVADVTQNMLNISQAIQILKYNDETDDEEDDEDE